METMLTLNLKHSAGRTQRAARDNVLEHWYLIINRLLHKACLMLNDL
jgi:hypothetical protein